MGLVSGILRLNYLKQMQLDLEYKIQNLTQTRVQLLSQGEELLSVGTDLDPDSPEMKHLEQRRQKLQLMEKRIQAEFDRTQGMLKMVEEEIKSAEQIVQNATARSFKYG